ncbi:MAG: hypothetical protein F6K62_06125 [Sphaerospermopsis sp. SIO1G2]|nr:hypothetical protein [Sphaerospermopsis sp. SIO1G2]
MFIDLAKAGFILAAAGFMFKALNEMRRDIKDRINHENEQNKEILQLSHRLEMLEQKNLYELKKNSERISQIERYLNREFNYNIRESKNEH